MRNNRVVFSRAGDSALLLDPTSGYYFSLSEVGARIWDLCDGSRTFDEVTAALAEEYDAPSDVIETDARILVGELAAEGLVEGG